MPSTDRLLAVCRAGWPAAAWAACLGAAALATWALGLDRAPGAGAAGLAVGLTAGAWAGRRGLARAAVRLLDAPPGDAAAGDRDAPVAALRPLARALHTMGERQQALLDAQAAQTEAWRRQAHTDPLTGLANRRHFIAQLESVLADGALPPASGLLLLHLDDLQALNQRVGHAAADRALLAVAEALQAYPDRIGRCVAGRLNGADFALLLPVAGIAQETAVALIQALQRPLAAIDGQVRLFAGAVELYPPLDATRALALVDAALARSRVDRLPLAAAAVTDGPPPLPDDALAQGAQSWQRRIGRALDQGRAALAAFPVRGADGRLLHLDCPLRVQLHADGPYEPASRWLALAMRSRLCAAVDERAVTLALAAIARDGLARCVNVAAQSVESAEFVAAVAQRLERAPDAAARLWIDLPEPLALERPLLLREVARRWRPLGVMLGLEHAGEGLARIPRLIDLGLDCVRIDSRFTNGITGEAAADARRHLQGLVQLVQAMGLQVTAEGVRDPADLDQLWQLGIDAATGPALDDTPDTPPAWMPGGAGQAGALPELPRLTQV